MSKSISGKKIIVVEDEDTISSTLELWFNRLNAVHVFGSAEAALEQLPNLPPQDIFIFDYILPQMNGIERFKTLRPKNPHAIFVLISGKVDRESAQEAYDLGLDALIQKPFDLAILEQNIADLVRS